jgi:hypothetical protein
MLLNAWESLRELFSDGPLEINISPRERLLGLEAIGKLKPLPWNDSKKFFCIPIYKQSGTVFTSFY